MKLKKLKKQDIIDMLVRIVCQDMSSLAVFAASFFFVCCQNDADACFRSALGKELRRRGIFKTDIDSFWPENIDLTKFNDDDLETVMTEFGSGREQGAFEDGFVEVFTGRDRWAERERKRRAAKKGKR
jgi:hypothetical protein